MILRRLPILLGIVALGIAVFLTIERARGATAPCPAGGGGCETVARSSYATFLGVPVSVFGIVGAALLLATFLLPLLASARLAIATLGAAFSAYLTWLEANAIHAYCVWCLASAATWLALFVVCAAEAWRGEAAVGGERPLPRSG